MCCGIFPKNITNNKTFPTFHLAYVFKHNRHMSHGEWHPESDTIPRERVGWATGGVPSMCTQIRSWASPESQGFLGSEAIFSVVRAAPNRTRVLEPRGINQTLYSVPDMLHGCIPSAHSAPCLSVPKGGHVPTFPIPPEDRLDWLRLRIRREKPQSSELQRKFLKTSQ